jgi:hypothetical protein
VCFYLLCLEPYLVSALNDKIPDRYASVVDGANGAVGALVLLAEIDLPDVGKGGTAGAYGDAYREQSRVERERRRCMSSNAGVASSASSLSDIECSLDAVTSCNQSTDTKGQGQRRRVAHPDADTARAAPCSSLRGGGQSWAENRQCCNASSITGPRRTSIKVS